MESSMLPVLVFFCLALVGTHASLPSKVYWHSVLPNTPMPKAVQDSLGSDDARFFTHPNGYKITKLEGTENVETTFFIETELRPGKKMKLHFTNSANGATFLPHQVAKSIPFSSDKLPEILNRFSVKENSVEAKVIKSTIKMCETPGTAGEDGVCATSLESLVDFTRSKLGKNVQVLSTQVPKETIDPSRTRLEVPKETIDPSRTRPKETIDPSRTRLEVPKETTDPSRTRLEVPKETTDPSRTRLEVPKETIDPSRTRPKETIDPSRTRLEVPKETIDPSRTRLGTNDQVLSTQVPKETKKQGYRITGVHRINANKGVVCHKQNYAYAVFYCHEIHDAGTYMVPLVSSDGTKVNAIAACNTDASVATAFKVLKVKPGTVPICHFLASDTLLWVPN